MVLTNLMIASLYASIDQTFPKDKLSDLLLEKTISKISSQGLDGFIFRSVATAADCSTTAIIQRFTNKAGLINAALELALSEDARFHQKLAQALAEMPISFTTMSDLLASYIELRANSQIARFWSEIIFSSNQTAEISSAAKNWHQRRIDFWQTLFSHWHQSLSEEMASLVTGYAVMEEVYAFELKDSIKYRQLLRETCRALLANSFNQNDEFSNGDISLWLNKQNASFPDFIAKETNETADKLLDIAADDIFENGIDSINQRRMSKLAGVASSMMNYHFGNMSNFINQAVWHALQRDIPHEFEPIVDPKLKQKDMREWATVLQRLTRPPAGDATAGFYNNYARLSGQASLLAVKNKQLGSLIEHLRRIDGWGTYRAGQTIWPATLTVRRGNATAFGVWIKGEAVINSVINPGRKIDQSTLNSAANLLFVKK